VAKIEFKVVACFYETLTILKALSEALFLMLVAAYGNLTVTVKRAPEHTEKINQ
jgi:hypothetical protein